MTDTTLGMARSMDLDIMVITNKKEFRIRTVREVLAEDAEKEAKKQRDKGVTKPRKESVAKPPTQDNNDDSLERIVFEI